MGRVKRISSGNHVTHKYFISLKGKNKSPKEISFSRDWLYLLLKTCKIVFKYAGAC